MDVGYDPTAITTGKYVAFDFNLKDAEGAPADFTQVWARIKSEDQTLLATGIRRQALGPTTLLYTFDTAGEYALEISFRKEDGNEIAAGSFPVSVTNSENGVAFPTREAVLLLCGAVAGALLMVPYKGFPTRRY